MRWLRRSSSIGSPSAVTEVVMSGGAGADSPDGGTREASRSRPAGRGLSSALASEPSKERNRRAGSTTRAIRGILTSGQPDPSTAISSGLQLLDLLFRFLDLFLEGVLLGRIRGDRFLLFQKVQLLLPKLQGTAVGFRRCGGTNLGGRLPRQIDLHQAEDRSRQGKDEHQIVDRQNRPGILDRLRRPDL